MLRHFCPKKKRYLEKDRQDVRFGFHAYQIFYEVNYRRKKPITYDHFVESKVYDAFVRFGKYIVDVNAIAPEEFIRFAISSKRRVDNWGSDVLYNEYVRLLNKHESYDRALERNLLLMQSWANKEGERVQDFFRLVAPAQAVQWLISGRISPWVIFNCDSGKALINSFSEEQFALLEKAIDIPFWEKKFFENIADVHYLQEFLSSEGI